MNEEKAIVLIVAIVAAVAIGVMISGSSIGSGDGMTGNVIKGKTLAGKAYAGYGSSVNFLTIVAGARTTDPIVKWIMSLPMNAHQSTSDQQLEVIKTPEGRDAAKNLEQQGATIILAEETVETVPSTGCVPAGVYTDKMTGITINWQRITIRDGYEVTTKGASVISKDGTRHNYAFRVVEKDLC